MILVSHHGNLVVDIGGGTTDVAVISIGNSVIGRSINVAGNKFDATIMNVLKKEFKILIGERTAEEIKMEIGCVYPHVENTSMTVRGRNAENGMPMELEIFSKDLMPALENDAIKIVNVIMEVLEKAPPELVQDISNKGIYLTGGGSLLYGLDKLISNHTGMKVMIADDAISSVAIGIGKSIGDSINISSEKKNRNKNKNKKAKKHS